MDEELHELAALALRNAFWHQFSGLVNAYLAAGDGLNERYQEAMIGELTSVYGRDKNAILDAKLNIVTMNIGQPSRSVHSTMFAAMQLKSARKIYLQGKLVFERRAREWYFVN